MGTETLILFVLLFPLIGGLINGTIGKNLSETVVGTIGTLMVAIPFVISFSIFLSLDSVVNVPLFSLLKLSDFSLDAGLQVDSLAIWMTMIITGIGSLIHIFSMGIVSGYFNPIPRDFRMLQHGNTRANSNSKQKKK